MNVNIGTARITGLTKPFYYNGHRRCYAWAIMFEDTSTLLFDNIPYIKLDESEWQAKFKHEQILRNFETAFSRVASHSKQFPITTYKKKGARCNN